MYGLNTLRAWCLSLRARRYRSIGRYNRDMLAAAFGAWNFGSSGENLVRWALIRRDLGWPISHRIAKRLVEILPELGYRYSLQSISLIAEKYPQYLEGMSKALLEKAASRFPALHGLMDSCDNSHHALRLIGRMQNEWRLAFSDVVYAAVSKAGLAVVGNAAGLRTAQLEPKVDMCDLVVRFNHYGRGVELQACVGRKTDVWVMSPAYKGPAPTCVPKWVVVSGPAMEYKLQDWGVIQSLIEQGSKVLTVPLNIWAGCVQQLDAPPSAGVLILYWLKSILNSNRQIIFVAGVGMHSKGGAYHLVDKHYSAESRHNWVAESAWLEQWSELRRLD